MEYIVTQVEELGVVASHILASLVRGKGAALVTLSGELGAGKTTLSQELGKLLGIVEPMQSPTFVLERVYDLPEGAPFKRLVHIDAYRLQSGVELSTLGFNEILTQSDTLVLLEWPEQVSEALPSAAMHVSLTVAEDGTRHIMTV